MLQPQAFPNDAQAWSIGQDRHKTTQATSAERTASLPMKASRRRKAKSSTLAGRLFASTVLRPLCLIPCLLAATPSMAQTSAPTAPADALVQAATPTAPTAPPGDNSNAVANTAFVQAVITQLAQAAGLYFTNSIYYSTFPNLPDPTDSTAVPSGWAPSDVGNLTNKLSLVFGSANPASPNCPACLISNRAQMDQHVEYNQIDGLAGLNIDGQAKDVNAGFSAAFRSYPAGDPHDTTVVGSDALYFHAFCSGTFGLVCQGRGNIVTGIVRPETWVVPGDIVETCMQRPGMPAAAAWFTSWLYGGRYPAAGTVPAFYGSSIYPAGPSYSVETDNPDGFPIRDGMAANYDLTPAVHGDYNFQNTAAVFVAASGGFTPDNLNNNTYLHTTTDLSAAMHCYQVEIVPTLYADPLTSTAAGKHGHIVYSMDGVEYEDVQFDWNTGPEIGWDRTPTGTAVAPASLMIALEYAPDWTPISDAAMTPANVSGAVAKLASIRIWHRDAGAHVAPTLANGIVPPIPAVIALTSPTGVTPLGIAILNGTYSSTASPFSLSYSIDGGAYSPVMMLDSFTPSTFEVSLPAGALPTGVHALTLKNGAGVTSPAVSVTSAETTVLPPGSIGYAQTQNMTSSSIGLSVSGTNDGGAVRRYVYQVRPHGANTWSTCAITAYQDQTCNNLVTNTGYDLQVYAENEAGIGPAYTFADVKTP